MFKAKTLFVTLALIFFAFSPALSTANSWTERAEDGGLSTIGAEAYGETGNPKDIRTIIATIIKVVLGFLGVIFVVLLIFAGIKYMTSGGDQEKVKDAVGQIKNAVIGLIIIVAAYSITYFITVRTLPNIMK